VANGSGSSWSELWLGHLNNLPKVTIITFEVLDAGQKILITDKAKLTVIETSLVGWFDETHLISQKDTW
jgi:hypothetical protein